LANLSIFRSKLIPALATRAIHVLFCWSAKLQVFFVGLAYSSLSDGRTLWFEQKTIRAYTNQFKKVIFIYLTEAFFHVGALLRLTREIWSNRSTIFVFLELPAKLEILHCLKAYRCHNIRKLEKHETGPCQNIMSDFSKGQTFECFDCYRQACVTVAYIVYCLFLLSLLFIVYFLYVQVYVFLFSLDATITWWIKVYIRV